MPKKNGKKVPGKAAPPSQPDFTLAYEYVYQQLLSGFFKPSEEGEPEWFDTFSVEWPFALRAHKLVDPLGTATQFPSFIHYVNRVHHVTPAPSSPLESEYDPLFDDGLLSDCEDGETPHRSVTPTSSSTASPASKFQH